ncbi:hypothetical protein BY996DRAFT_4580119 [Phakopsora pachyrhizi]|nr:hypothetical protein BY996DRAFT_4580119 [Phakopsora pachyrhizi]
MKSSSETSTKIVFSTENHSKIAEELSHLKLQKYENQDLKSKKIDYLPGYEHSTTIGKDGNCQFRAISLILHNNQERHEVVRSEVVDYIKTHRNYYEVFILPIKFEDYVEEMSKNGNWGDEITLRAAIEIYKLRVFVLSESENGAYVKKYGKVVKSNEVFSGIFFKSKHYEILLQTNEN